MAFDPQDFKTYIYTAAEAYRNQFGLNIPTQAVPDQNAARLFESYTATPGLANLVASRRGFYPANPHPWISGHPNQEMYGGNNWQRVCCHDAGWRPQDNATVTLNGNCVAITRRHVLMSRHGTDVSDPPAHVWTLQWIAANGKTITRTTAPVWVDKIPATGDHDFSYRMAYLSEDLPPYFVCPILDIADMPSLAGIPVVCYNNYKEATAWTIDFENRTQPLYNDFRIVYPTDPDPNNPTLSKLWRQFAEPDSQYGYIDYWGTAANPAKDLGSGSPLFLVFTNSVGQSQFVYFGSVVIPDLYINGVYYGARGPSYKEYYSGIRDAVNTLNAMPNGGNGRDLQPVTITDTEWTSPLMNGLVSYWKMNETSGGRAAAHGGFALNAVPSSIGSTNGWVYPQAADFLSQNNGYMYAYGAADFGFPGSITVSVWFLLRDYSPLFSALITKDDVGTGRDWSLSHYNGYLEFAVNGSAATVVKSPFIQAGQWHHVLAWWSDDNRTTNIRFNGGQVISQPCGMITRNDTHSQLVVGGYDNAASRYPWDGRIGPISIWSRPLQPPEQGDTWCDGAGAAYPYPLVNY